MHNIAYNIFNCGKSHPFASVSLIWFLCTCLDLYQHVNCSGSWTCFLSLISEPLSPACDYDTIIESSLWGLLQSIESNLNACPLGFVRCLSSLSVVLQVARPSLPQMTRRWGKPLLFGGEMLVQPHYSGASHRTCWLGNRAVFPFFGCVQSSMKYERAAILPISHRKPHKFSFIWEWINFWVESNSANSLLGLLNRSERFDTFLNV